ncbi:MAG: cation:proton antiporter, partial [Pseudomonadota bacterium]
WSLLLLLLFPARHILGRVLAFLGHGELLILYGFVLALGGAELFESVGVKGDIGALVVGVCLAGHSRAEELSKAMLSFKDLFLLSFFLSIGLAGVPSLMAVGVAALLAPLAVAKAALFFGLFSLHRLRLRTAFQGALSLANYSEFGLIVAAVGVANGWLDAAWLVLLALSLAFSFLLSALGARYSEPVYRTLKPALRRFERQTLTTEDQLLTLDGAKVAVVGMGGVGSGAYDALAAEGKLGLVGVDLDPVTVASHTAAQRRVLRGDPTDPDFWDRIVDSHTLDLVLIALPKLSTTLDVIERLSELGYDGEIAATCRFEDEAEALRQAGASTVFNLYDDAGVAFVARAEGQLAALLPTP